MKKLIKDKIIPISILLISFIILLVRSKYSFCLSDEPFYLATASRFYNGDSIFFHEWFPTQLSSLLLVPFYSLYLNIHGSTEGIFLFFRVLYVIFEFICSVFVYHLISKHHGPIFGIISGLLVEWYVHLNIATLSYYTMTIQFFLLTMLIIYDCYKSQEEIEAISSFYLAYKKEPYKLIIAGFLFALSVLCLPTLCIPYFLIVIAGFLLTILSLIFSKSSLINQLSKKIDFLYVFKYTLIGIIVPAAVFIIYLLTHVSVTDFINSIPYVLTDDEHITSKLYPLKKMYLAIDESYGRISKLAYLFILGCIMFYLIILLAKYSRKREISNFLNKIIRIFKPVIFAIDVILFMLYLSKSIGFTGYIFTALMFFTLPLFLITEKKNYLLFILTIVSGLIYSLTYSYSSNGMLYVLAMGHFIASIGGIILTEDFIKEIGNDKKIYKSFAICAVSVIFTISTVQTMYLRIVNIYRDDVLGNLTSEIEKGPANGLYTSESHLNEYNGLIDSIEKYCMKTDENGYEYLLVSKLLPLAYLVSDLRVAAPSVWRNPMNSERLKAYYEFVDGRYPDVIFVLNKEIGSYETCGDIIADPIPNENDNDGYMYDYIDNNGFTQIVVPYGVIYQKP